MQMTRIVTVTVAVLALAALASRAGVLAGPRRAGPGQPAPTVGDARRPGPGLASSRREAPEAPSAQP